MVRRRKPYLSLPFMGLAGILKQTDFDLALIDLKMPGMGGAKLLSEIRSLKPDLPVTIVTAYPNSDLLVQVLEQGPLGVISKPFSEQDILTAVERFPQFTAKKTPPQP